MVSAQKSATKPAQAKPVKATPPAADLEYEQQLFASGARTVAGIDEVGRGSMAGPVTVGVAILTPDATLEVGGLIDSKALSPARRESMVPEIRQWCAVAVGHVEPADIDRLGMTLSLRLAAQRALAELARRGYRADAALLDGKHDWFTPPQEDLFSALAPDPAQAHYNALLAQAWEGAGDPAQMPVTMVIKGDYKCASIAAASVVAKVERDELMVQPAIRGTVGQRTKATDPPLTARRLACRAPACSIDCHGRFRRPPSRLRPPRHSAARARGTPENRASEAGENLTCHR